MKTSAEIKAAVGNIKYYAEQIHKLSKEQLELDMAFGREFGINTDAGSIVFDCLAAIDAAGTWIEDYCLNILKNTEYAEAFDKQLNKPEEEAQNV